MGTISTNNCEWQSDKEMREAILFDWVNAAFELQENHNKLTNCFLENQSKISSHSRQASYIGQCPSGQLTILIKRMEQELKRLLDDLDTLNPSPLPASPSKFKKLAAHTLALNKLNQQAQTRLLLAMSTVD
jgi:hypothetical protein